MKNFKRFLSMFLVVCTLVGVCSINVSAASKVTSPTNGGYYRIQHVGSGKYWDITNGSTANGARLQIWPGYAQHQNQVFYLQKVGNYWKIVAHNSGKVIEVRDSSKSNNAHVAQWDYAGISCQLWSIICNKDGTVSFKNKNSGKYIDVSGNGTANGTKMIQYQSNGTTAQKFRLYRLYNNDICSATWTRKLNNSNIYWTRINWNNPTINYTSYSKSGYYPSPGYTYLKKVEYIDATTVHEMLANAALSKSTLEEIKDIVFEEQNAGLAQRMLKEIGFDNVPGVGIALGVLETLATSESRNDWNNFVRTTRSGKGIKKITYVKFVSGYQWGYLNNGTTKMGYKPYVDEVYTYTYSVWDGNGGVRSPSGYSGYWNYTFK